MPELKQNAIYVMSGKILLLFECKKEWFYAA
jgi:hypothetical protein